MATILLGTELTTTDQEGTGVFILSKFTASATGVMNEFRLYSLATGSIKYAIYADSSGNPGNLITAMSEQSVSGTGWKTLPFTNTNITSGTAYWLALTISANGVVAYKAVAGSPYRYKSETYATFTFPATPSGLTTADGYLDLVAGWENSPLGPANVKTFQGIAKASVKTLQGVAIASVKSSQGVV